jgi:hypothetical protein
MGKRRLTVRRVENKGKTGGEQRKGNKEIGRSARFPPDALLP